MYTLLLLTLLIANFPFLTQRGLGIIPLKRKTILHHLAELALGFIIIAAIALIQLSGSLQIALTGLGGGLSIGSIWTFVRGNKQITSR